jgi:hypothetical protein
MRALEISIFLLFIPICFGLVNAMNVFTDINHDESNSWYDNKTVDNLQSFQISDTSSPVDYALFIVTNMWMMIIWIFKLLTAIFWLWPLLVGVIGVPAPLAIALQLGLWIMYVLAFMGIRSGTNPDNLR